MNLKIASYNIRIDMESDGIYAWDFRKKPLTDFLKTMDFDFIGIQEARNSQYEYLKEHSGYEVFGKGRSTQDDPYNEACPILFHPGRFELEEGDTFWLSETPERISKYKDADCLRIAVWGIFRSLESGKQIAFINTHFDHISKEARVFAAKLLVKFIGERFQGIPVFLTGDFNENEEGEWHQVFEKNGMLDTRNTSLISHTGPYGTATGYAFERQIEVEDYIHIDFIFANPVPVIKSAFTLIEAEEGKMLSDHLLVYINAEI